MEELLERCCGLDVHKKSIVACLLVSVGGRTEREVRTFATTTRDLLVLREWLIDEQCRHVAMESTGSYWKPVYNVLEDGFDLLVVNAQRLKAVPGRKTDVRDSEWIADLFKHGLLTPSFIPSRPEREMRELTRYRTSLLRERASEINRLQKVLEGANIKLGAVATDVVGMSGRAMLTAIAAGETDVVQLADLALGNLRNKKPQLQDALTGFVEGHQRFMLRLQLRHIEELGVLIGEVSSEIECRLRPLNDSLGRLMTIPGVGRRTAETFLSEVGADMSRFPSAQHLASWAGLCPGNNESAGKSYSGRTRKGSPWLKAMLVEAAAAAAKSKTYLGAQYRRLAARKGAKKAALAVAHTIAVIAYHLLSRREDFADLGYGYFDERQHQRLLYRLTRRLESLGYRVQLDPVPI